MGKPLSGPTTAPADPEAGVRTISSPAICCVLVGVELVLDVVTVGTKLSINILVVMIII